MHSDPLPDPGMLGTRTLLVAANPDPGIDFIDPSRLAGAIEDGATRADPIIEELASVWGWRRGTAGRGAGRGLNP